MDFLQKHLQQANFVLHSKYQGSFQTCFSCKNNTLVSSSLCFYPMLVYFHFPFLLLSLNDLNAQGFFSPIVLWHLRWDNGKTRFSVFFAFVTSHFLVLLPSVCPQLSFRVRCDSFFFPLLFLIHHSLLGSFPILFSLQVTFFGLGAFVSLSFGLLSLYPYMAVSSRSCNCPTSGRFPGFEAMLQSEQLL